LRVVAELAHRYGPAVASLVLYRDDVPEDQSVIAEGEDLVRRALTLEDVSQKVTQVRCYRPRRASSPTARNWCA
jgi:hypothetical protein